MWLVRRSDPRPGAQSISVSEAAALRAAYEGSADSDQTESALALFRKARDGGLWLACGCRADEGVYPLSSPAYLTTAGTYYLRRLTGEARPNHAEGCLFRFERPQRGIGVSAPMRSAVVTAPSGLFSVLTPEYGSHVAGQPRSCSAAAKISPAPPRLARQLWRLMAMARLNRLGPVQRSPKPSIKLEFASLRETAERVDVYPGTALARVLATHPGDYHSKRLFARIRAAKKQWKEEAPLQGFLLLYAHDIKGKSLLFDGADPIEIEGELLRGAAGPPPARGPYLVLAVVGDHGALRGLAALRACAQPVYSGGQFVAVAGETERRVLKAINSARWSLARSRPALEISVEKPLFDIDTPDGPARPDFIVDVVDGETGEIRTRIVDVMDAEARGGLAAKSGAHAAIAHLGEAMTVDPSEIEDASRLARRVGDFLGRA